MTGLLAESQYGKRQHAYNIFGGLILVLNVINTKNATIPVRAHMYLIFELTILQMTHTLYISLVT